MPITRKAISQKGVQLLKAGARLRTLAIKSRKWQFVFGPKSLLQNSIQIMKIGVELDPETLASLRFVAYLYNPDTGMADSGANFVFNIYKVTKTGWQETPLMTFSGTAQPNRYFYAEKPLSDFVATDFDGGPTMMVEVSAIRLGVTYRDRIYINHLGIHDSLIRLAQKVDFLDITKVDL